MANEGSTAVVSAKVVVPPVHSLALLVGLATVILYLTNTVLVAGVLTLVGGGTLRSLWQRCAHQTGRAHFGVMRPLRGRQETILAD